MFGLKLFKNKSYMFHSRVKHWFHSQVCCTYIGAVDSMSDSRIKVKFFHQRAYSLYLSSNIQDCHVVSFSRWSCNTSLLLCRPRNGALAQVGYIGSSGNVIIFIYCPICISVSMKNRRRWSWDENALIDCANKIPKNYFNCILMTCSRLVHVLWQDIH